MRQLKISKQITNRESQSLDKYLQEIGKVDLLTPDEEVELAKRIREGDQMALEKLTKANLSTKVRGHTGKDDLVNLSFTQLQYQVIGFRPVHLMRA